MDVVITRYILEMKSFTTLEKVQEKEKERKEKSVSQNMST